MARAGAPTPQGASVPLENYKKIYIYIYMYVFTLRPLTTSASSSFFLFVYLFIVLFLTPTKINLGPIVQWFLHLYFPFFSFSFFLDSKYFSIHSGFELFCNYVILTSRVTHPSPIHILCPWLAGVILPKSSFFFFFFLFLIVAWLLMMMVLSESIRYMNSVHEYLSRIRRSDRWV